MTKWQLIAKLALTVLGILVLVQFLTYAQDSGPWGQNSYFGAMSLVSFVAACWLLFLSDGWPERIAGPIGANEQPVGMIWVVGGFRIVLAFCGLVLLADRMGFLVKAAAFIVVWPKVVVTMIVYRHIDPVFYMAGSAWVRLIVNIAKTALGIYLALGAPRFVRWQASNLEALGNEYLESKA